MNNIDLQQQINDLKKEIESLKNSNSIPYEVENAFQGRGFLETDPIGTPPGDWFDNEGFIVATDPNAQAPAVAYLRVRNKGATNFWIPLYTFSQLT